MKPFNNPAKDFLLYPSDEPFLKQLAPVARNLLELATNEVQPYAMIAAGAGLPMGTVKSRINRARAQILKMRADAAVALEQTGVGYQGAK